MQAPLEDVINATISEGRFLACNPFAPGRESGRTSSRPPEEFAREGVLVERFPATDGKLMSDEEARGRG